VAPGCQARSDTKQYSMLPSTLSTLSTCMLLLLLLLLLSLLLLGGGGGGAVVQKHTAPPDWKRVRSTAARTRSTTQAMQCNAVSGNDRQRVGALRGTFYLLSWRWTVGGMADTSGMAISQRTIHTSCLSDWAGRVMLGCRSASGCTALGPSAVMLGHSRIDLVHLSLHSARAQEMMMIV
jgi:hypothetical protein